MFGKTGKSKHGGSSRGKGSSGNHTLPVGFLFLINKLVIQEPERDDYHHHIPPRQPHMYSAELPSKVFRYSNGEISEAGGYHWYREQGTPGVLFRLDYAGNYMSDPNTGNYVCAEEYKTFSVAACNPLLPIMVGDSDPSVYSTNWELLRIFHPPHSRGLSQVVTLESNMGEGGAPVRYVAGKSPSWMPGLLPKTYRSPHSHSPGSTGLGGELPIILGLMALCAEKDRSSNEPVNQLFLERCAWRRNEWRNGDTPRGYPDTAQDDPCIFLVKVFLDPENPASTEESLLLFEWHSAVVRESSSSSGSR
ncbi:Hypothetical protein NCS54_01003200 [Fusarium falciforme]|uniref:Hypothetical protein n=1 Tax=Fusarium falciforme TaxID=195108 RepID=UPI0023002771|nr:Hypothetical protein NCS54_01003200 [Fusarium falciforme]WAO92519.1 Hypothetical protein NCS54_01003200 [Fusarium falciforme]